MNINCKVQILSLWDLWSCWYRWVSVGNTVFSSRQSPFIIFHWSLVTLRTFQGYVFEEPWCSSSKGQPIYVVSNAKPNVCSSWLNYSLLYTNLPSLILAPPLLAARTTHIHIHMLLLHHHNHLHARPKVPIQLLHQYWRVRLRVLDHLDACTKVPINLLHRQCWRVRLQVLDHLGHIQSSIYTCTKPETPKDLICL